MDYLMDIWIFLIGLIMGFLFSLSLLYSTAVKPLRKKIDCLQTKLDALLSESRDDKKNLSKE